MKNVIVSIIALLLALFYYPSKISAQEYRSDFKVEYQVQENNGQVTADVHFNIKITNLYSDIYVKKFSLIFPKIFSITNLTAADDLGEITPQTSENNDQTNILLEFSDPKTGRDSTNNLYVNFQQKNLFTDSGNIWEVILPTIENKTAGDYTIIVSLPKDSNKKISIAKPKPDVVLANQLIWNNPKTKTIYAVFGDTQHYQTKLVYNLENPKLVPVYTDIALPPDTLSQKIYISNLSPVPTKVYLDSDGNYMARYNLSPKESKTVVFEGTIDVLAKPRIEVQKLWHDQLKHQKNYLLNETDLWRIKDTESFKLLKTPFDIYQFVIDTLTYDYDKLSSKIGRVGAESALKNKKNAVCTEFTDLFIGLSREKGYYAREIEGYGFSSDPQLRPLSFASDLLHSWPEYYDRQSAKWMAVDPTWQDTSGIDYFSSFDLNHIAFAIHGKDPLYPHPAGTYKTESSKDVLISPIKTLPTTVEKLELKFIDMPNTLVAQKKYQINLVIKNLSNVYLYQQTLNLKAANLSIEPNSIIIDQIAPYEEKNYNVYLSVNRIMRQTSTTFTTSTSNGLTVYTHNFSLLPAYYDLALKYSWIGIFLIIFLIFKLLVKKRT